MRSLRSPTMLTCFSRWLDLPAARCRKWFTTTRKGRSADFARCCTWRFRDVKHRDEVADHLTQLIILHIRRNQDRPPSSRKREWVRVAEAAWERDPALSVEEVARRAAVSVSALRKAFVEVRGHHPMEARNKRRVERAVRLLRQSTLKLEAVASMCGFDSASHLSRRVKEMMGSSPGQLRLQIDENPPGSSPP